MFPKMCVGAWVGGEREPLMFKKHILIQKKRKEKETMLIFCAAYRYYLQTMANEVVPKL